MSLEGNVGSLCATCTAFDWEAWLKYSSELAYILHPRFGEVFDAASAGCRLCKLLAYKYESTLYESRRHGEEDDYDKKETKALHMGCLVALEAERDTSAGGELVAMKIILLEQEQVNSTSERGPIVLALNPPPTTEILNYEDRKPTTVVVFPTYDMTFGISISASTSSARNYMPIENLMFTAQSKELRALCSIRSSTYTRGAHLLMDSPRLQFLRDRLADCCTKSDHKSCKEWPSEAMPEMPTRVIDCHNLRLVETRERGIGGDVLSAPYSILSHCWGARPVLKTTKANYKEMCQSIEVDKVPATIRDAILFSKAIGLRYIWVDSFCIIQPEEPGASLDHSDWSNELPNMHKYYQNSAVALCIETASCDDEGFLETLNFEGTKEIAPQLRSVSIPVQLGSDRAFFQVDYEDHSHLIWAGVEFFSGSTPLRERGWTLQEFALSPRRIHIMRTEMVWSCASFAHPDRVFRISRSDRQDNRYIIGDLSVNRDGTFSCPENTPWEDYVTKHCEERGIDTVLVKRQIRLQQWYRYVAESQRRAVTYSSDKLPAISAIASDMALHLGYHCYAGIWIEDAAQGLAWTTHGLGLPTLSWRAPSWSWAALDCKHPDHLVLVTYFYSLAYQKDCYSLQVKTIPSNCGTQNLLVQPTALDVVAHILPYQLWPDHNVPTQNAISDLQGFYPGTLPMVRDSMKFEFDSQLKGEEYCTADFLDIVLLRLGTWVDESTSERCAYALMLRINVLGTYSRVGIAAIPDNEQWWDKGWERAELTLV